MARAAIEFIFHNPGVSQNKIAKHIGTVPTVMVGILDVLTARGFVERVQSKTDRRYWHVRVTKQGKNILAELKRLMFAVEKVLQTESGLNQKDWNTLQKLLQKLTNRG
jgi:DNA-binding MarR family transcriptional regulator